MTEQELKNIMEELIEPIKEAHIHFLNVGLEQMEKAFEKGIEVGKKLKD